MTYELLDRSLLDKIRQKFHYVDFSPYAGKRIFLDSVSGSLRLKKMGEKASSEIASYAQKKRIDPASDHFAEIKNKFKEDSKLFLGAQSGYIIPAMSGTHTIFRLVNAVCADSKTEGNIVTTNLEHPAAFEATHYFAEKYNLARKVADFDKELGYVPKENVLELIDENTQLLMIIHASNVTGGINDIKEIVKEARYKNPNIFVIVDGVQFAPHGLVDVEKLNVDAYAISGYKIYCKKGSGIGYISERFDKLPHWQFREKPEGEWAIGAEDESTYAGFSAVVDYLKWLGGNFTDSSNDRIKLKKAMEKIESHTKALMKIALEGNEKYKGLKAIDNINIYGLEDSLNNRTGLISFKISDKDSKEVAHKYFDEARISVSTRETNIYARHVLETLEVNDLIRVSICHYNSPKEIEKFLDATNQIASASD